MTVRDRLRKLLESTPGKDQGITAMAFIISELDVLQALDDVRSWQIKDLQRRLELYEGVDIEIDLTDENSV